MSIKFFYIFCALVVIALSVQIILFPVQRSRRALSDQDKDRLNELSTFKTQLRSIAAVAIIIATAYLFTGPISPTIGIPLFTTVVVVATAWRITVDFHPSKDTSGSDKLKAHLTLLTKQVKILAVFLIIVIPIILFAKG